MTESKRRRFAFAFSLALLAVVLPLASAAYLQINSKEPSPIEAALVAGEIDRLLQMRLEETFTFAALPSVRAFAATAPAERSQRAAVALNELQAWIAADTSVREAFVVDRSGLVTLSTGKDWSADWSSRAFVNGALAGRIEVSAPSHDADEFSQYYAAPILDNRGQIAGALIARIAAEELWNVLVFASDGSPVQSYAILIDENSVRIADGGDPSRIFTPLTPLTVEQQTRIMAEHTYGAQTNVLRAANYTGVAELASSWELDRLSPAAFGDGTTTGRRLTIKPWMVMVVSPPVSLFQILSRWTAGFASALLVAIVAALLLTR